MPLTGDLLIAYIIPLENDATPAQVLGGALMSRADDAKSR
jgi:hypothetical protein